MGVKVSFEQFYELDIRKVGIAHPTRATKQKSLYLTLGRSKIFASGCEKIETEYLEHYQKN
ncbi:hypothetical protein NIES4071_57050 [Calothrix sp. NIES-4071]|nr:hypothetical protein NIES4071_57050 [Calothrix sp. NIES-4071]BAZ60012.1 hypothetical protein NIES4105_57000 [Calothrix sp. NIES-4105]